MAAVTEITSNFSTVDATSLTSATSSYTVSGVLNDEDLNIVFYAPATLSGTASIERGDYINGDSSLSGTDVDAYTIEASKVSVITGIDGSKYRTDEGQVVIDTEFTGAGTITAYAFTKKTGF